MELLNKERFRKWSTKVKMLVFQEEEVHKDAACC